MPAMISQQTAKATRRLFQLLEDNFDPDAGKYAEGYTDERIATETGITVDAVKAHRINAFGKIRPPLEIAIMQADLSDLQSFALKTESEIPRRACENCQAATAPIVPERHGTVLTSISKVRDRILASQKF